MTMLDCATGQVFGGYANFAAARSAAISRAWAIGCDGKYEVRLGSRTMAIVERVGDDLAIVDCFAK